MSAEQRVLRPSCCWRLTVSSKKPTWIECVRHFAVCTTQWKNAQWMCLSLCRCVCVFRLSPYTNSILYHNRLRDSAAHDQFSAASSTSLPEEPKKRCTIWMFFFRLLLHTRIYDTVTANTIKRMHNNGERWSQWSTLASHTLGCLLFLVAFMNLWYC